MEVEMFLSLIQTVTSLFQLKLDFSKNQTNDNLVNKKSSDNEFKKLEKLGIAIRNLEYSVSETFLYISNNNIHQTNHELNLIWKNTSEILRSNGFDSELVDITFEKSLYYLNPEYYRKNEKQKIHEITLQQMKKQLATLNKAHERLTLKQQLKF